MGETLQKDDAQWTDQYRALSDSELLVRYCRTGDQQAFEALVHRYERPIYNYLVRYLRNPPLAEEVFQATFLRVHQKCRSFAQDRPVRPWLYSIATRQAIDALRREGRHPNVSLDEQHGDSESEVVTLLNLIESTAPSPWEQADEHERAAWTRQAVDNLPDDQRAVVLLIYFQGFKYREVAEILEIPVGTVKSRVHKALVALNAAWRREHRGDEPKCTTS